MAAIDSIDEQGETGVIPEGDGYLLIPAANDTGYIPIKAVYSPHLTSTLIGENCIMGETKRERNQYTTQTITKHLNESTFSITCVHQRTKALNLQIGSVLINGQPYSHPLISLDLKKDNPHAMP